MSRNEDDGAALGLGVLVFMVFLGMGGALSGDTIFGILLIFCIAAWICVKVGGGRSSR